MPALATAWANSIAVVKDLNGIVIPKEDFNSMAIKRDDHSIRFIINLRRTKIDEQHDKDFWQATDNRHKCRHWPFNENAARHFTTGEYHCQNQTD